MGDWCGNGLSVNAAERFFGGIAAHRPHSPVGQCFVDKIADDVADRPAPFGLREEVTGDVPTPDELVDRGMQRLLDSDRGFRQWLQQRAAQNGIVATAEEVTGTAKRTVAVITSE